jgi:hypothetical protein
MQAHQARWQRRERVEGKVKLRMKKNIKAKTYHISDHTRLLLNMDSVPERLTFGKWKGNRFSEVPFSYLRWLTHWEPRLCDQEDDGPVRLDFIDNVHSTIENISGNADYYMRENLSCLPDDSPIKSPSWWEKLQNSTVQEQLELVWKHSRDLDNMQIANGYEPKYQAKLYTWFTQHDTIVAARRYMTETRICFQCGRKMPPIGNSRSNGASHDDWSTRKLHKQCFRDILKELS